MAEETERRVIGFPKNPTPGQAVALQRELAARIWLGPFPGLPRIVAGVDVSCERSGKTL